jgi:hypothetical protein
MSAAKSPEVDLGQSLRSALDVGKHRAQKFPVSDGADGVQLLDQAPGTCEPLLDTGDDQAASAAGMTGPGSGVDDAPLDASHRWHAHRMRIDPREVAAGFVDGHRKRQQGRCCASLYQHVDPAVVPPIQSVMRSSASSAHRSPPSGPENGCPLLLRWGERPVVGDDDRPTDLLPPTPPELVLDLVWAQTAIRQLVEAGNCILPVEQKLDRIWQGQAGHASSLTTWRAMFQAQAPPVDRASANGAGCGW